MDGNGWNKESKCSSIKVGKNTHTLVLRNNSTLKIVKMHFELNNLNEDMEKAIYVPNTHCKMHDVDEYKKKNLFHCHNEKLAIVYGFINIPIDMSLIFGRTCEYVTTTIL